MLCLRDAAQRYASARPLLSQPRLSSACLCLSSADPRRALPSPRVALPRFASANPDISMPCLRRASPNRAQPWLRGSPLLHRLGQRLFSFPPLNRSVRCHCRPAPTNALPLPVIAALWFASASNLMSWPCRRTSSPRPSLPPPLVSMLCFSSAVLSVRGPSVLCPASASHRFYLPCLSPAVPVHAVHAVAWCCAASQVHATPQLSAFFRRSAKSSFSISPICSQMNFPLPEFRQHPSPLITP